MSDVFCTMLENAFEYILRCSKIVSAPLNPPKIEPYPYRTYKDMVQFLKGFFAESKSVGHVVLVTRLLILSSAYTCINPDSL